RDAAPAAGGAGRCGQTLVAAHHRATKPASASTPKSAPQTQSARELRQQYDRRVAAHLLENVPVEQAVVFVALALEQLPEESLQVSVVGAVLELQRRAVREVVLELVRVAAAELLGMSRLLSLQDALVLLLLRVRLEALPGQAAAQ